MGRVVGRVGATWAGGSWTTGAGSGSGESARGGVAGGAGAVAIGGAGIGAYITGLWELGRSSCAVLVGGTGVVGAKVLRNLRLRSVRRRDPSTRTEFWEALLYCV